MPGGEEKIVMGKMEVWKYGISYSVECRMGMGIFVGR